MRCGPSRRPQRCLPSAGRPSHWDHPCYLSPGYVARRGRGSQVVSRQPMNRGGARGARARRPTRLCQLCRLCRLCRLFRRARRGSGCREGGAPQPGHHPSASRSNRRWRRSVYARRPANALGRRRVQRRGCACANRLSARSRVQRHVQRPVRARLRCCRGWVGACVARQRAHHRRRVLLGARHCASVRRRASRAVTAAARRPDATAVSRMATVAGDWDHSCSSISPLSGRVARADSPARGGRASVSPSGRTVLVRLRRSPCRMSVAVERTCGEPRPDGMGWRRYASSHYTAPRLNRLLSSGLTRQMS